MLEKIYQELDQFPKRLKRRDKQKFLDYLKAKLDDLGYDTKESQGRFIFKSVNLETDNDNADIILAAHYDTPTILPFYFEYLFRIFGHTRQFFMLFSIFLIVAAVSAWAVKMPELNFLFKALKYTFFFSFLALLIPNPHNRNDNTSGVATLLNIAEKIAKNPNLKKKVKFIFFDNEELGLLGSFMQKKKWKKEGFEIFNKKFISIDCVAHGKVPVIVYHKNDATANQLHNLFFNQSIDSKILRLPFYPISDNYVFAENGAVNISWMDKTLIPGGYYIRNVHNPRDIDVDYDKIETVTDIVIDFFQRNDDDEKPA